MPALGSGKGMYLHLHGIHSERLAGTWVLRDQEMGGLIPPPAWLQEARMSRAAEVMVQHVENLKRHHMREHAELEEMKRLIQQNSRNRQLAETQGEVGSAATTRMGLAWANLRDLVSNPSGGTV